MKRLTYILSVLLLGAVSCVKEDISPVTPTNTDGEPTVTVNFYVDAPEANPATKAFADEPSINDLHIAIFGSSGYLKEYVEAEFVKAEKNYDGTDATVYQYKAKLTITGDKKLYAHFIANGPSSISFSYESDVIAKMLATQPQDCYWQRIELPHGIQAQTDQDGDYINADGDKISEKGGEYQVLKASVDPYITKVPLIRNFARIKVTAAPKDSSHIVIESYALYSYPQTGSVAPYDGSKFIAEDSKVSGSKNYQDYKFAELREAYEGNLPATATINTTIPTESDLVEAGGFLYMYERPVPTEDNATAIIIKTKYYGTSTDGEPMYYKIYLKDADGFLPVYRNFQYVIHITEIMADGYPTIKEAVESTGSGDISANTSTASLTDISDGKSRLFVEYTDKTIVGEGTYTLKVKYIPDVDYPEKYDNSKISIKVGSPNSAGAVFASGSQDGYNVVLGTTDDKDGWRTITYTTYSPGEHQKVQQIKVTGSSTIGTSGTTTLYRYVNIRLLNKKEMSVECIPHYVKQATGEELDAKITIPLDLPSSIFPLYFNIEAENANLTPYNDNLPVYSGASTIYEDPDNSDEKRIVYDDEKENKSTLKSGNVFSYKKTLQYSEYKELEAAAYAASDTTVSITAHFKTTDTSKGGIVYVTNDYFYDAYDSFKRYTQQYFTDLAFSTGSTVFEGTGEKVNFTFKMQDVEEEGCGKPVTVTLKGLVPDSENYPNELVLISDDDYYYYPSNNDYSTSKNALSNTLHLLTSTEDSDVQVILNAECYVKNSLTAERGKLNFTNEAFSSGSTVAYGKGQSATFSFNYVSNYVETIYVKFTGLEPSTLDQTYGTFEKVSDGLYTFKPKSSAVATSFYLTTTNDGDDVSVVMYNEHYNTSTTTASRAKYDFTGLSIGTAYLGGGNTVAFKFSYATDAVVPIQITVRGLKANDDRLSDEVKNGDGTYTYTYTPSNTTTTAQTVYFSTLDFGSYVSVSLSASSYNTNSTKKGRTLKIAASGLKMTGDNLAQGSSDRGYSCRSVSYSAGTTTSGSFTPDANTTESGNWWNRTYTFNYAYNSSDIEVTFDESTDVSSTTSVSFSYTVSYYGGYYTYTYTASSTVSALQSATSSDPVSLAFKKQ